MPKTSDALIFLSLARRVQRRLFLSQACRALGTWGWIPWLGVAGIIGLQLAGLSGWALPIALLSLVAWVSLSFACAWKRRPSAYAALALWDATADRKELFSNALAFAQQPQLDAGRELHLIRARIELDEIVSQLPRELPLAWPRGWVPIGPLIALGLALTPWTQWLPAAEAERLNSEQLATAQAEAEALAAADQLKNAENESLTDEERRLLEELRRQQEELAAKLQQASVQTPRELLDALEQQARAAEELAQQLGAGKQAWASAEMLEEMKRHADTAELAEKLEDKNAGGAAEEARALADVLQSPDLSQEATERLATAFSRTMAQATEADRTQLAGQHLAQANEALQQDQPTEAGEVMQSLAEKFARQQQREQAQAELEKLAEQLRQSGQNLMSPSEGLQKLASSSAETDAASMGDLMPLSEMASEADNMASSPLPEMPLQQGAPRGTPIPGTGPPPKDAKPLAVIPGTAPATAKPLAAATPIPGTGSGGAVPIPGAGSGAAAGQPGAGGLLPGRGAAALNGKDTTPTAAAAQGEVTVAAGQGESFTQTVQGQPRQEGAQRAAQGTAAAFLRTQESALDEQNLPPARRQQVKRYFDSLRQRFGE